MPKALNNPNCLLIRERFARGNQRAQLITLSHLSVKVNDQCHHGFSYRAGHGRWTFQSQSLDFASFRPVALGFGINTRELVQSPDATMHRGIRHARHHRL